MMFLFVTGLVIGLAWAFLDEIRKPAQELEDEEE
jgi:hypothetical protein